MPSSDNERERSGRSRRADHTLNRAKEMDHLPLKTTDTEVSNQRSGRKKRAETEHAQTGELILTRAQELNGGEKTELVIDENAGTRPDYSKNSRTRRGELILTKNQE
ncbi:hypothetical protein PFISCL1PPCAC_26988, partial [Pristionchus fissidentatus]